MGPQSSLANLPWTERVAQMCSFSADANIRVSRTDGYGDTYYWTRSGRASYVKGQQLYECSYQAPFHDIWHCSLTAPNIISLWNLDRDENVRVYNNSRGQPNYDAIPTNH